MINLKPVHLVDKFLKSATFEQKYTERIKRILTLIVFSIWLLAFTLIILVTIEGFKGAFYYSDAQKLLKDLPLLEKNRKEYLGPQSLGGTQQFQGVDKQAYKRVGIENVEFWDDTAPLRAISLQEDRMQSFFIIPIIFTVFYIIPWLLLRLFFWIKKADNDTRV